MIDLTMASLLPLLITSVTAASVSICSQVRKAMFQFHLDYPFFWNVFHTPLHWAFSADWWLGILPVP